MSDSVLGCGVHVALGINNWPREVKEEIDRVKGRNKGRRYIEAEDIFISDIYGNSMFGLGCCLEMGGSLNIKESHVSAIERSRNSFCGSVSANLVLPFAGAEEEDLRELEEAMAWLEDVYGGYIARDDPMHEVITNVYGDELNFPLHRSPKWRSKKGMRSMARVMLKK